MRKNSLLINVVAMVLLALIAVTTASACTQAIAEANALGLFPGGTVLSGTHLETEGGVMYYDIHVRAKDGTIWSVEVNASTCRVIGSPERD